MRPPPVIRPPVPPTKKLRKVDSILLFVGIPIIALLVAAGVYDDHRRDAAAQAYRDQMAVQEKINSARAEQAHQNEMRKIDPLYDARGLAPETDKNGVALCIQQWVRDEMPDYTVIECSDLFWVQGKPVWVQTARLEWRNPVLGTMRRAFKFTIDHGHIIDVS